MHGYVTGGVLYNLNNNDVVRLTINSDTRGQIYITDDTISTFYFDDVGLTINSIGYGRAAIGLSDIWIKNSGSTSSTLRLNMPSQSAWTQLITDGSKTIINGGSSAPVGVYSLWNSPSGVTNLDNLLKTFYDGPVSGYSIT